METWCRDPPAGVTTRVVFQCAGHLTNIRTKYSVLPPHSPAADVLRHLGSKVDLSFNSLPPRRPLFSLPHPPLQTHQHPILFYLFPTTPG
jgi:hypothetical protein